MNTDLDRLIITLTVLIGGAILIAFGPNSVDLTSGVLALDGLVIGWWFPRNGHTEQVPTADMRPWEGA